MINKDHILEDDSMINSSIKVMWSLSIQKDYQKCKNQDPNHLKWQPQASNDTVSNSNKTKSLTVYHQNTRDLPNKAEELISFLSPNFPQVLCLTEHHLKDSEMYFIYI